MEFEEGKRKVSESGEIFDKFNVGKRKHRMMMHEKRLEKAG